MRVGKKNQMIWSHVKSTRRQRATDLNMVPVMNLFLVLIPCLLLYASFIEFAFIRTSITEILENEGEGDGGGSTDVIKLSPIIMISKDGYIIKSRSVDLTAWKRNRKVKRGKGEIDVGKSRDKLKMTVIKLKKYFPEEFSVSIAPDKDIPYKDVVSIVDLLRTYEEKDEEKRLFSNIAFVRTYEIAGEGAG